MADKATTAREAENRIKEAHVILSPNEAIEQVLLVMKMNIENARKGGQRRPPILWGPPGIGKSAIMSAIAKRLNYMLLTINVPTRSPTELTGMPVPYTDKVTGEERVAFAAPDIFPRIAHEETGEADVSGWVIDPETGRRKKHSYDGVIFFFDEIGSALPAVQQACNQALLEGRLGDYVFPTNAVCVAASNREEDRCGVFKSPRSLDNRFFHYYIGVNSEEWMKHILGKGGPGVSPVVSFIQSNPSQLMTFRGDIKDKAFATPRSWESIIDFLNANPDASDVEIERAMYAGVGAVTPVFMAHYRNVATLPKASDVFSGKVKEFDFKDDLSMIVAMGTELAASIFSETGRGDWKFRDDMTKEEIAELEKRREPLYDMLVAMFRFAQKNFVCKGKQQADVFVMMLTWVFKGNSFISIAVLHQLMMKHKEVAGFMRKYQRIFSAV